MQLEYAKGVRLNVPSGSPANPSTPHWQTIESGWNRLMTSSKTLKNLEKNFKLNLVNVKN